MRSRYQPILALALVDREATLVVGGDPLAGRQVDRGEAQRQALVTVDGAGLAEGTVAELQAFAADVQRALATAGAPVMTPAAGVCAPFQIRLEVRIEATLSLSP